MYDLVEKNYAVREIWGSKGLVYLRTEKKILQSLCITAVKAIYLGF